MSAFTPTRRRLYAAAPAVLILLVGLLAFIEFMRVDRTRGMVAHTAEVIGLSRIMDRDLAEAESAQRGYLLAGEDNYLPAYTDAVRRLEADTSALRRLTRDNPRQQARLDTLGGLLTRRIELMRHRIAVRRGGGLAMVTAEMLAPGAAVTDSIGDLLERLEAHEQGLLGPRIAAESQRRFMLLAIFLFGVLAVAVLAWLVHRTFAQYATAQDLALERIELQNAQVTQQAIDLERAAGELEDQRDELQRRGEVLESQAAEMETLNEELTERTMVAEAAQAQAEAERRRSVELIESISDAFFRVNAEWRVEYANARAAEIFQVAPDEAIGRDLWSLVPEHDPDFERRMRAAMRTGVAARFEDYDAARGLYLAVALYPSEAGMSVFLHDMTDARLAQADFRVVAESIPQLVWSATAEGRLDYRNERYFEYTGLPRTGSESWDWIACVHPVDAAATMEAWQRSLTTGEPYEVDYRLRRASDGAYRWFTSRAVPVRAPDGRILHWFGTSTDVHEEREASDAVRRLSGELRASLDEMQALFEVLPVGVAIADDADCRHIRANPAMAQLLSVAPEENVSLDRADREALPFRVFRDGRELAVHELPMQRSVALKRVVSGDEADFEAVFVDGSRKHVFVTAVPLLDEMGDVRGSVGAFVDGTARMAAEAEVRRLGERNAKLYAFTAALARAYTREQVAAVAGEWGRGVFSACASYVTMPGPDGLTLDLLFCAGMPDEFVARWKTIPLGLPLPMPEAARSGRTIVLGSRADRYAQYPLMDWPAGLEAMIAAPLRFEDRLLGVWALHFDTSRTFSEDDLQVFEAVTVQCAQAMERARLFEAEREAREQAEQANQAKLKFLRVMSHDLRTPLNAILGYTELLQQGVQGPMNDVQRTYLARILASTGVLRALIDDILEFARIEAGHVDIRFKDVALMPLLSQVEDVMLPQIRAKNITLSLCDCPDAVVRADPERLRQILMNLVSNAHKFTPEGGQIRITCQSDEGRVRISVHDNGVGIPPEQLERIFEPFVQAHRPAELGVEQGVGLGLAISRELARAMDGEVTASGDLEVGSTFTLELARAQVEAPVAAGAA